MAVADKILVLRYYSMKRLIGSGVIMTKSFVFSRFGGLSFNRTEAPVSHLFELFCPLSPSLHLHPFSGEFSTIRRRYKFVYSEQN